MGHESHDQGDTNERLAHIVADANLNRAIKLMKLYRTLFFALSGLFVIEYIMEAFHAGHSIVTFASSYVAPPVIALGIVFSIIIKRAR